jgi:hypothetical protein
MSARIRYKASLSVSNSRGLFSVRLDAGEDKLQIARVFKRVLLAEWNSARGNPPLGTRSWDQGCPHLFDAAHHFTPFASHPVSAARARPPKTCIRVRVRVHSKTDAWSDKTVPARKGANARAVMAHAQAEAIPNGNAGVPQGIRCAWVWQFTADCCASRVGVVRATLCRSRGGGQRVLG